jgi:hypothetical protein
MKGCAQRLTDGYWSKTLLLLLLHYRFTPVLLLYWLGYSTCTAASPGYAQHLVDQA